MTIVPVGAGTCRSVCVKYRCILRLWSVKGLLSLDMRVLRCEVMIFLLGGFEIVGMALVLRL